MGLYKCIFIFSFHFRFISFHFISSIFKHSLYIYDENPNHLQKLFIYWRLFFGGSSSDNNNSWTVLTYHCNPDFWHTLQWKKILYMFSSDLIFSFSQVLHESLFLFFWTILCANLFCFSPHILLCPLL